MRRRFRDPRLLGATVKARVYPELETRGERIYHFIYDEFTWAANALGLGTASGWCQVVRPEALLFAAGRSVKTDGLGLEEVGVATTPPGWIRVDEHFQTSVAGVFAVVALAAIVLLRRRRAA